MRILLVHQRVDCDRADELDVLVQAKHVREGLETLGHAVDTLPVEIGLSALRDRLNKDRPDCVFNLVESLGGTDARIVDVPRLLEELRVPYTGCSAAALAATNHKVHAKQRLREAGLPTPDWATLDGGELTPPYIVKAIEEHASIGLSARSVVTSSDVPTAIRIGDPSRFAESFIDGRELNVSLLAGAGGSEVLPLAEIDFAAFEPNRVRIVDYAAKWDESSFAYQNTPRRFLATHEDHKLLSILTQVSINSWNLFDLRGYARVDFRVDQQGNPWILEVNCNPCLAPDAGFAAALAEAGIAWPEALRRILADVNLAR